MTKVPHRIGIVLAACLAVLSFLPAPKAQEAGALKHQPGPAESLYLQLAGIGLDPAKVFRVRDASIDRSAIHITLEDGTIAFTSNVLGKVTGAFFEGDGEILLAPPNDVERRSMSLFTGMAILEERFSSAYFRFNDNTPSELQPGLRAPEQPEEFAARWEETARNLAQQDAMRLLTTFSEMLPSAGKSVPKASERNAEPVDRMMHARLQGTKLGVFDVFFDSTADEEIEAGQARTAENGKVYYDVWTSFSIREAGPKRVFQKEIPQTLPEEPESRANRILVHSYIIDAHIKPPTQLEADVRVQLDAVRGGSRCLMFELSRFLHISAVEADGKAVEFIQNPAVEGTRLARSGNDLVAVILPEPAQKGQKISLRFVYSGEVLAEAGKGLLYIGARGEWYPNRGLAVADFDLTFHYPRDWTLLATGKATPVHSQSAADDQTEPPEAGGERVSRWVSERPIPMAGFNLGKYVRAEAKAGNVPVETYATIGVERDFPAPPPKEVQPDLSSRHPRIFVPEPPAFAPSPARNAMAVATVTAAAIQYYADRFGPYPYSQLALTQMPGHESQGWPGLIFLSSYAFLNREEREDLQFSDAGAVIEQLIPAHEAAHQWWGDLVTWKTYHDQWFSEGLANYCSMMMLQEKNPAAFRLVMDKYRHDLIENNQDAGPVTLGTRLLSSRFPEGYEAISYGRATWLFHMLRSMLQDSTRNADTNENGHRAGDEPFVRCLRKLRERYEGKSITTRDLLAVFAEDLPPSLRYEGKSSLDWFLNGWVNGTSLPRLELHSLKFVASGNATQVTGMIRQNDAPEDLVTSVPLYAVIPGKAPILLRRVFADGAESSFHLTAPAGTHKLLLDPNDTILTGLK